MTALRKLRIVVLATPRSGSSYLRTRIDGSRPIFGELLLKTSDDPLTASLRRVRPSEAWPLLATENRKPSDTPGAGSQSGPNRAPFVGLKIMASEFFNRNARMALSMLRDSDVIVVVTPLSLRKQIKSLYKIRQGGYAHYYVAGDKMAAPSKLAAAPDFRALLKCIAVICANRTMLSAIHLYARFLRPKIVVAAQRDFKPAQKELMTFINERQTPSSEDTPCNQSILHEDLEP